MENLNESEDINSAWVSIKRTQKPQLKRVLSPYELKQHKSWFDEEC